jgi:hypothetical protein
MRTLLQYHGFFLVLIVVACRHAQAFAPPMTVLGAASSKGTTTVSRLFYHDRNRKEQEDEDNNNRSDRNQHLSSMSSASRFSKGKQNDVKNKKYATGSELDLLRNELNTFRETLQWAQAMEDKDRVVDLTAAIARGEKRDPDVAYARAVEEINNQRKDMGDIASSKEEDKEARRETLAKEAALARSCLPRFQMEGLWVGK